MCNIIYVYLFTFTCDTITNESFHAETPVATNYILTQGFLGAPGGKGELPLNVSNQ